MCGRRMDTPARLLSDSVRQSTTKAVPHIMSMLWPTRVCIPNLYTKTDGQECPSYGFALLQRQLGLLATHRNQVIQRAEIQPSAGDCRGGMHGFAQRIAGNQLVVVRG